MRRLAGEEQCAGAHGSRETKLHIGVIDFASTGVLVEVPAVHGQSCAELFPYPPRSVSSSAPRGIDLRLRDRDALQREPISSSVDGADVGEDAHPGGWIVALSPAERAGAA